MMWKGQGWAFLIILLYVFLNFEPGKCLTHLTNIKLKRGNKSYNLIKQKQVNVIMSQINSMTTQRKNNFKELFWTHYSVHPCPCIV